MTDDRYLAGRYRILKTLGAGGMGVVHLVEDTQASNRVLALKTLKAGSDEEAEAAFRAEFRTVRGVQHPNIPTVYDFGVLREPDSLLYFTCEFVEGRTLDALLDRWNPELLRGVLVELCRALAFLHSRGLLHRDVKPENVLAKLDEHGNLAQVKLMDFGLAAFASQEQNLSGTLDYLAPELIVGERGGPASDLYALGVLMFRLATGKLPFEADGLSAAKQRATSEAPSPLRFRPDLPVGLSDVISELLRLKPEERPPSARHVIALLNEREGTDFPYETPATRTAYIHSAASVTQASIRRRLSQLSDNWRAGRSVPNVVITGSPGLGRTRLLRDFADELALAGISVQVLHDPHQEMPAAGVTIVPNWKALGTTLEQVLETLTVREGSWLILSGDDPGAADAAPLSLEVLLLQPLDREGVRSFTDVTFPGNSFPQEFYQQLFTLTLGFPVALQSVFSELLRLDLLQIDLNGWQLLPTSWSVEPHAHVSAWIRSVRDALCPADRTLLDVLALSTAPLPIGLLHKLAGMDDHEGTHASRGLDATGWIESCGDQLKLSVEVVRTIVKGDLPETARRRIHAMLRDFWNDPKWHDHPAWKREWLYHDWHAGSFVCPPAEALEILNEALAAGNSRWARDLATLALTPTAPPEFHPVARSVLANAAYAEGDLESAAVHYTELLDRGQALITNDNLAVFARYAMIEEKLGRPQHAQEILERCMQVLPEGQDVRAGIIYGTRAWIEFRRGDGDQARRLAEEGLVRIPPGTADMGYALLLNTVATLSFYHGDMDAARMFWTRSLEIHDTLKDRKGQATLYNNLGVLAAQSGDRLRARTLWEKCAAIAREIGDIGRLAGIYNNLGIDSLESGALADAEQNYLKALVLFRRMKSPREQVAILSNLGELAYYRADFMRAQSYWQEALDLAAALDDQEARLEPQVYLAKLNILLDNSIQAEEMLNQARLVAHEIGSPKAEGQALEVLAKVYAWRGELDAADATLRQAHELLSEEADPLAHLHLHLTECEIVALRGDEVRVVQALAEARRVAETKWDPFAAARLTVNGLLFAHQKLDGRERARSLRQLSIYPEIMWRLHWGLARQRLAEGAARKALDEFGRGVAVLKGIATRLSEEARQRYLNTPAVREFKAEALKAKRQASDMQHS